MVYTCSDCGFEGIRSYDTFCPRCGLVFDDSPVYDNSGYDTYHAPLGNGVELESKLTRIEMKYGWKSPSADRYYKLNENYYDIFVEEFLKYGFSLAEIDIIFLNDFTGWYKQNSKKTRCMKRKDVVNKFLEFNFI